MEENIFPTYYVSWMKSWCYNFFSISAWFLLEHEQTIKNSLRRIWLMEKEVLFWSLCLACLYLIFAPSEISKILLIKSFALLNMNVWWYATAYATFLALLPFLSKELKALGRNNHLILATIALVIWGVRSFIPDMMGDLPGAFGFIYVFILISAYKWYIHPFTAKQIWLMIGLGFCFFILYTLASVCLSLFGYHVGIYIAGDWKPPVIMIDLVSSCCSRELPFIVASLIASHKQHSACI